MKWSYSLSVLAFSGLMAAAQPSYGNSYKGASHASAEKALIGKWRSGKVHLTRGDLDEAYYFTITLSMNDTDEVSGLMDIEYFSVATPDSHHIIRQNLTTAQNEAKDQIILMGNNPTLISGPAIVGIYEPDQLFCSIPVAQEPSELDCDWGSSAHGIAPKVTLKKMS